MKPIYLLDMKGRKIAGLFDMAFDASSTAYSGRFSPIDLPDELRQLLGELEEVVDGQSFALVDGLQQKIDDFGVLAVFDDGSQELIKDLYLAFDQGVSFRVVRSQQPR